MPLLESPWCASPRLRACSWEAGPKGSVLTSLSIPRVSRGLDPCGLSVGYSLVTTGHDPPPTVLCDTIGDPGFSPSLLLWRKSGGGPQFGTPFGEGVGGFEGVDAVCLLRGSCSSSFSCLLSPDAHSRGSPSTSILPEATLHDTGSLCLVLTRAAGPFSPLLARDLQRCLLTR